MPLLPSDRPVLRPCDARRQKRRGGLQVVLHDNLGIASSEVGLSQLAYQIACCFDGEHTLAELHVLLAPRLGAALPLEKLIELAETLDEAGFLRSPRFEALKQQAVADFHAAPVRAPICAGGSYPSDPAQLRRFLDAFFTHPDGPGGPGVAGAGKPLRALVAPHIDLHRGGPSYAHAYRALREGEGADLFVVFGTAHVTPPHLFTLTRKDYDTPLGAVKTDQEVIDVLVAALGERELFDDELVHQHEHSVEFQMVWLKHLYPDRAITAVPVLCSGIDHLERPQEAVAGFLKALAAATQGRKVCFIAGADLAHVGVLYGDGKGPTKAELAAFARDDRETVGFFCRDDAAGFALDARRNGAARKLCGTAPMFAARLAAGGAGELLHYRQWSDGTDSVSFCAVAVRG
jgi:hypothetical protein